MTDQPQAPATTPDPQISDTLPLALEAAGVARFLQANPSFFVDHEDLLASLRLPHQRGDTVSLVERQMKLLRDRNIELRQRLTHLMDVARDNDRLFDKSRRLILALLDANSLDELVISVEDSLRQDFQVPFVSLVLFHDTATPVGRSVTSAEAQLAIGSLLAENKPVSGTLREHELDFLFGVEQRKQIGSTALAPLSQQGLHGVLAIASRDPHHYKSSVGTLFLSHIAEVLGRVLPRHLHALRAVR